MAASEPWLAPALVLNRFCITQDWAILGLFICLNSFIADLQIGGMGTAIRLVTPIISTTAALISWIFQMIFYTSCCFFGLEWTWSIFQWTCDIFSIGLVENKSVRVVHLCISSLIQLALEFWTVKPWQEWDVCIVNHTWLQINVDEIIACCKTCCLKHRHTLLDAYSVFVSIENFICQTCGFVFIFQKTSLKFYLNYFYFWEYQYW